MRHRNFCTSSILNAGMGASRVGIMRRRMLECTLSLSLSLSDSKLASSVLLLSLSLEDTRKTTSLRGPWTRTPRTLSLGLRIAHRSKITRLYSSIYHALHSRNRTRRILHPSTSHSPRIPPLPRRLVAANAPVRRLHRHGKLLRQILPYYPMA